LSNVTQGAILSTATTLPVTAATSMMIMNHANFYVILAFMALNIVTLGLSLAMVTRYFANRKRFVK
jgi:Ca2+/Na+ antiporter